jgi:hypothetical protein
VWTSAEQIVKGFHSLRFQVCLPGS